MAKHSSSQKFIGKNNAPRVQIEYDVEVYGSQKKVSLPFVTGVMSDLSGKRVKELPPIAERKFLTFDKDNFDSRMRAIQPTVKFFVKNTLDKNSNEMVGVDLNFESMDDFEPGSIAKRVPATAALLEARTNLVELMTYMDGKAGAEQAVKNLIEDPDFLVKLAKDPKKLVDEAEKNIEQDNKNSKKKKPSDDK